MPSTRIHRIGPLGPRFACTFNAISIQAAQDLFEIVAPSNSEVRIREIKIGQYTDFGDVKSDLVSILVMTGHTTGGSGGTQITPNKLGRRSGASVVAGSTVKRNNTTQASGGASQGRERSSPKRAERSVKAMGSNLSRR